MPLLDHFHPPLSRSHPWRGFHGAWAAAMARLLNAGVLPPGYYAVPFLDRDGPVEIDVGTLQDLESSNATGESAQPQSWQPTEPVLAVTIEWPATDDVCVEVNSDDGDPKLAATVELVSPRIKDRVRSREAFAAKCAEHLRRGCGVVVVDAVTTRRADLQADLFLALGVEPQSGVGAISAVSYRAVGRDEEGELQVWPAALEVGALMPTLPLWLSSELAVPLDLEASHSAACHDLRIRRAG